mgnify:CR=1 FL=1
MIDRLREAPVRLILSTLLQKSQILHVHELHPETTYLMPGSLASEWLVHVTLAVLSLPR